MALLSISLCRHTADMLTIIEEGAPWPRSAPTRQIVFPPKRWNRSRAGHELPDPHDNFAALPVLRLYEIGGHGHVGAELGSP